ncbi:MAG: hypothetical protein WCR49_13210, partial [Opitutae bacterium]
CSALSLIQVDHQVLQCHENGLLFSYRKKSGGFPLRAGLSQRQAQAPALPFAADITAVFLSPSLHP